MTAPSRLIAVDHVEIQAPLQARDEIAWFYGQLIGLEPLTAPEGPASATDDLRFRGERHELQVALRVSPAIETVAVRVDIEVSSLEEIAAALDDRRHPYDWIHGLSFTQRSLMLLDPAGNRVRLRKRWPSQPL